MEQGGFRSDHCCSDLIFALNECIAERKERKKNTWLCFIDVKKAYDTVWLPGLWKRLYDDGIKGPIWKLLQNWYQGVESSVITPLGLSKKFPLQVGVRQGSVLSPTLYSLFVSPIVEILKKRGLGVKMMEVWMGILMYADDMVLIAESREELQEMLKEVERFSCEFRFELSVEKTEVMLIGKGCISNKDTINLQRVLAKAKARAAMMGTGISKGLSPRPMKTVLRAGILPIVTYAAEVWSPTASGMKEIEKLQYQWAKRILGVSLKSANVFALSDLSLQSLESLFMQRKLEYLHRLVNLPGDTIADRRRS